jgi:hypothetical protein
VQGTCTTRGKLHRHSSIPGSPPKAQASSVDCFFRFETMAKILATCDSSALLKGSARRLLRWHSNIPHILSAAHQTRLIIGIFELDSYLSYSLSTTLLKAGQLKCQGPSGNAQARKSRIGCLRNVQTEESPRKSALF